MLRNDKKRRGEPMCSPANARNSDDGKNSQHQNCANTGQTHRSAPTKYGATLVMNNSNRKR